MLESILLVSALSIDAFAASVAYGTNQIRMPIGSILLIDFICAFFLGVSLLFGTLVRMVVPEGILIIISFITLMILGIYYLFEGIIKSSLKKSPDPNKRIKINLFKLRVIIDIYMDQTKADFDYSKHLNSKEALYLAFALSLDSLAVGFGSSIVKINCWQVILFSLISGIIAIGSGLFVGRKLALKSKIDLSWLGGIILIILAIMKLFYGYKS